MDSKDCLDNGAEFIVITQTLVDLCDRVCALNDSSELSASIRRDGQKLPNVPQVLGEVNSMVTNDHGGSVYSGCTKIVDGARNIMRCGDMEQDESTMHDEARNNLISGVNEVGIDHHQNNNNQNKLCSNCNESFQKDQHRSPQPRQHEVGDGMKTNGVESNKIDLSMNGLAESENIPSISDGCVGTMVGHIVGLEVEADNELKSKDSTESSSTCLHSNSVAIDQIFCQETPSNKYKGTVELIEDNLNYHNENMDGSEITESVGNEVVSKTSNDSKESSLISGSDPATVVNDFTFVLNVVKDNFEQMQMLNEVVASTSQDKDLNQDWAKKESESSEDSSSSSSDSSSDDTDSECEDTLRKMQTFITEEEEGKITHVGPPKTKDEVLFSELPPLPTMDIRLDDEQEIKPLGEIESILNEDAIVIIKSFPDVPAIDSESILFLENGSGFGEVFDVFGQVKSPHYCVRFNSKDEIEARQLSVGQTVFYAPSEEALTHFVFVSRIKSKKGSDASWQHDQEPPEAILDYSDDEAESKAKTAKRRENRMKNRDENQTQKKVSSDAPKNVTKQRPSPSNQPNKRFQSSRRNQASHPQLHHTAPHMPFNSWPRNHQSNFYGGRFPQEQNLPLQLNPMVPMQWSPPPRYPYHQHQLCQSYSQVPQHLQHPPPPPPAEFIGQHPLIAQNADHMFNHHGQPDPCNFRPPPQNMVPPPPQNIMVQPLPPQNIMVPPPPQNMVPPPPQNMVPPPPQNMVPPPPSQNMVPPPPPPQNMVPPLPQNMVSPPPQNIMVLPPPYNMVPQPPQNMVPQLPPQNIMVPPPQNVGPPPSQNMVPPHPRNMGPPHQNVGLPVDQPGFPEQFAQPNGHLVNQGQFMTRAGWLVVPPQIRPQVPENGPVVSGNTVIITVINKND